MITAKDILDRVPDLLADLAKLPVDNVKQKVNADLLLRLGKHLVVVKARGNARAGVVAQAAEQAREAAREVKTGAIPLIAVPFMGDVGRRICRDYGVCFVDLSGNADIEGPGLRVHVAGKPNLFVQRGRPSSVFAPKSSRLTRILLQDPGRWWRQLDLAKEGQLGVGYVSRICGRLEEDRLVERDSDGRLRPRDPNLLLEAWRDQYDFRRHEIRPCHVASRSGEELARRIVEACTGLGLAYALTGLAAAWLLAPFAEYRLVVVYLRTYATDKLLHRVKGHEEKRGANLWLVRPNDEGVFQGAVPVNEMMCVSAVQAYLDLGDMPERAEEAAEHLRKERMQWR